jgi:hypothetical protein
LVIAHVEAELGRLATLCDVEDLPRSQGWTVDQCRISREALAALREAYLRITQPVPQVMLETLRADGVNTDEVFQETGEKVEETARADAVELIAAATAIKKDGATPSMMYMPNVPKMSRRYSSRGLDVLVARLDPRADHPELEPGEGLDVYSVKHTVADADDLVRKLRTSLSSTVLTASYVFGQLRVLHGRLEERGINADRIFLVLTDFHESPHVTLYAVGCVDETEDESISSAQNLLPETRLSRRFRRILVPHLEGLQDAIS